LEEGSPERIAVVGLQGGSAATTGPRCHEVAGVVVDQLARRGNRQYSSAGHVCLRPLVEALVEVGLVCSGPESVGRQIRGGSPFR